MDHKNTWENGMRTKSFRDEDYSIRRVFLRSYPLHWGEEEEEEEVGGEEKIKETVMGTTKSNKKKHVKKIILSVFHWGEEKVLVLRRFKHKLTIYVIACIPARLKHPTALLSA